MRRTASVQGAGGGGVSKSSIRKLPLASRATPVGLELWAVAVAAGPQKSVAKTRCPPVVPIALPPVRSSPRPSRWMRPPTSTVARRREICQGKPPGETPRTTLRAALPVDVTPDAGSTPMPPANGTSESSAAMALSPATARARNKRFMGSLLEFRLRSSIVLAIRPVARSQEAIEHEVGDFVTKPLARAEIESEMLPSVDPTQRGFLGGRGKRLERAFCPRHHFGGDAELEGFRSKNVREDRSGGSADDGVRPRIRRIRRRLADLWKPVRIRFRLRITIRVRGPDRGHRPPEVVRILRVVERDDAVRDREVQQGEKARVLRRRQGTEERRGLGDPVPGILDWAVPETAGQGLVRSCRAAGCRSQRFQLIDGIGVGVAGQRRGRPGAELIGVLESEWSDVGPMRELRLRRKIRRCRLICTWHRAEDVFRRLRPRPIIRPQRHDAASGFGSNGNPFLFS